MSERQLHCSIVTPEKSVLETAAERVVVPAHDGEVGILPGHARFLAKLGTGECRVTHGGKTTRLLVESGFVQVADDRVTVLTDRAIPVEEIDLRDAQDRVEEARSKKDGSALAEATSRLHAMERAKKKR
jgi:F-type H+-transporting ATPase subunit epsilon